MTDMNQPILIGGGARSGKSAFALRRARQFTGKRVYLATAQAGDDEMTERIERHVRERGDDFQTIEAPIHLVEAIHALQNPDVVIVDCLTFWFANLLLDGHSDSQIERQVTALTAAIRAAPASFILVTNEVGMGVVPDSVLGRRFRDLCGRAHQHIVPLAREIYFGALGAMIRIKPEPLSLVPPTDTRS